MDCLVRMFHGGIVTENEEFDNIIEEVEIFESPPTYVALVPQTQNLLGCEVGRGELKLRGRFDCGKARAHYVLMDSLDANSFKQFEVCDSFDLALASGRFDSRTLDAMEEVEDGDISLGSEVEDEGSEEEVDEEGVDEGEEDEGRGGSGNYYDEEEEHEYNEDDEEEGGGEEEEDVASWAHLSHCLPEEDRRMLESHNVEIPQVHFHEDLGHADLARCDMGLGTMHEGNTRDWIIHVGLRFETLEKVKYFMQDYFVHHYRPYKVKHSNAGVRYTVVCNQGCP
ncbi:hypothetical protein BS78_05G102500 [Paspalum vaginatum]|nr:hypothetical protein BS78_05G102500 [Paspalum vaginatum]